MKDAARTTHSAEPQAAHRFKVDGLKWAILLGFWTFFSFLYANQIYFEMLHNPMMHHSWWRIVYWQLVVWYAWCCLTPVILGLGRRFPVEGNSWLRGLLLHLPVSVALCAFHIA